jgi:Cu(I)/Ag(I) efflux system membrane fusion protein
MVASDTSKADIAASRVMSAGETIKNTLNGNAQFSGLMPNIEIIMKQSDALNSDQQNDIELKRASFEKVSNAIYALLKGAKLEHAGVYQQYCPMAFNDKGAYWLSNEAEIKNPYFGKKMMECGEVKDSL